MFKIKLVTFLIGIRFSQYWRLLWRTPGLVEWRYLPRALLLFCLSVMNSLFARCDDRRIKTKSAQRPLASLQDPLFILGHWGSGTTYLHKLMACDTQFNYPTLIQVSYPSTYLCTQALTLNLFSSFFPKQRHWDHSSVSPLMAMEDELALAQLSLKSPYLGWVFPEQEAYYDRYLSFADVDEDEVAQWRQALIGYYRKLQSGDSRRLLLKSPPHTARIKALLACYPKAKFIHLHRHPLQVYQATLRLYQQALPYFGLQQRDPQQLQESILNRYQRLYQAYFNDLSLLSANQHCELGFDDLTQNPISALRQVYDKFSLRNFEQAAGEFSKFIESVSDYQEPAPILISHKTLQQITQRWASVYRHWGYDMTI